MNHIGITSNFRIYASESITMDITPVIIPKANRYPTVEITDIFSNYGRKKQNSLSELDANWLRIFIFMVIDKLNNSSADNIN